MFAPSCLVALSLVLGPALAQAHEGQLVRFVRASARPAENGFVALDVMATLSLPRTASMLAIAQLDFNHDGRFDTLETAMAEAALSPRAVLGLEVGASQTGQPDVTMGPPAARQTAVQIDVKGKHVSVAVLSTWLAALGPLEPPTPPALAGAGTFLVRFAGPGEALDFSVSAAPGLTLEGPTQVRLRPGDAGTRLRIRPSVPAPATSP